MLLVHMAENANVAMLALTVCPLTLTFSISAVLASMPLVAQAEGYFPPVFGWWLHSPLPKIIFTLFALLFRLALGIRCVLNLPDDRGWFWRQWHRHVNSLLHSARWRQLGLDAHLLMACLPGIRLRA